MNKIYIPRYFMPKIIKIERICEKPEPRDGRTWFKNLPESVRESKNQDPAYWAEHQRVKTILMYLNVKGMVGPLNEVVSRTIHMVNHRSEMECSSFVVPTYDSLTYQRIFTVANILA